MDYKTKSSNKNKLNSKKKEELSRIATKVRNGDSLRDHEHLAQVAANIVAPSEAEPVVFPGLGRRGVSRFRIVQNVTAGTQFGVRASPSLTNPLSITAPAAQAFQARKVAGKGSAEFLDSATALMYMGNQVCDGYTVMSRLAHGYASLPLVSSPAGAVTVRFDTESDLPFHVDLLAWDGAAWVTPVGWTKSPVGGPYPGVSLAVTWAASYTDYRFVVAPQDGNNFDETRCFWVMEGATISCAPAVEDCAMTSFAPEWTALLQASQQISIVAMDVLLTYKGSSLNDNGSVAGAYVEDESIEFSSTMYDTLALRPFDRYEGRLAPKGEEEGGVHIHYVPSDLNQLLLGGLDRDPPYMYAAVKGKTNGESVRIDVSIVVNYYSIDPSYNMQVAPPLSGLVSLFSHLRQTIPVVTSNDGHVKKLAKFVKKKGKTAMDLGRAGYQFSQDHGEDIARLATLMATLL